jgi:hypothetical protein
VHTLEIIRAPHIDYIYHSRPFREFFDSKEKETKIEKEKEKLPPPRLGRSGPTNPRAPALSLPLSPAQATQLRAPRASLTSWPRPSATCSLPLTPLPLSGSLAPPVSSFVSPMPSPAHPPPSPSHPVASPLRRAPAPATPATVPEPSPHPPPTRAIPSPPRLPEPSQSALAPFPPSWRARRCSPSPPSLSLPRAPIKGPARAPSSPHQLRPSPLLSPEPIELAPPCLPRRSGSSSPPFW